MKSQPDRPGLRLEELVDRCESVVGLGSVDVPLKVVSAWRSQDAPCLVSRGPGDHGNYALQMAPGYPDRVTRAALLDCLPTSEHLE